MKLTKEQKSYVLDIYYSLRGSDSYGSLNAIYNHVKREGKHRITKASIAELLSGEEVFHSHLSKHRPKHYAKIVVPEVGYQLEMDVAYMPFPRKNRAKFLVLGIDSFSRKLAGRAVNSLKAPAVNRAVNAILDELGYDYKFIRTDRGMDFNNKLVKATFSKRKIKHFNAFEPNKSSQLERSLRTIKQKVYKVLQRHGDHNWSKYIQDVLYSHNHTKTRVLYGLSPSEVTAEEVPKLWFKMKNDTLQHMPLDTAFKFEIGDQVKLHLTRKPFQKEFNETVLPEVYTIEKRIKRNNVHLYKVKHLDGTVLDGIFREDELEKVRVGDNSEFRVDRVVARKKVKGVPMVKLRYIGYGPEFDTWEPKSSLINLKKRK